MSGHIDDDAVDHFAAAMKEKLAEARTKGRNGWHECDPAELSCMLRDHVEKGDPRDVANFCMFLWSLGQPIGKTVIPIGALADVHDLGFERGLAAARSQHPEVQREIAYTPGEWFDATTVDLMEAFYRSRLPAIREAARQHGYAIGVHGSLRRDLDLIAAPWRDGASDADTLAAAIQRAACGFENEKFQWEQKPLGRLAVSMPICWTHRHGVASDGHIDLSVVPCIATPQPVNLDATSRAFVRAHVEAERAEWTGMKRVYIAGPMTGLPDLNFPAFHSQAARYRARGIEVVNPAEINADPNAKWVDCMRADIRELVTCDGVVMLPGWDRSKGATLEHHIAQLLELRVIYLP